MSEPDQTPWPEGVIARYLTVAGATVDIADRHFSVDRYRAACRGCSGGWSHDHEEHLRSWAQEHAERCRALPRPEVQR